MTILGVPTTVKHFRSHYVHGDRYSLAYGFGRINRITYVDHPCLATLIVLHRDIVFSRINGQEHGTFVNVDDKQAHVPANFELGQNYPNPFNPSTTIEISVPQTRYVNITVFDLLGQEVATLVSDELQPGRHKIQWDATGVSSGVYFYRFRSGDIIQTKRLMLLR
ncbi:MAG: T9SS type A sorting domain-containing protein [Bacteroidota bacterium]